MDYETEFFKGLIELQYGRNVERKLKKISQNVHWAQGWPEDKRSFWNAEAFMWGHKIETGKRELITSELKDFSGKNLDLGCGAYSYIPSVGADISEKMLLFNEKCSDKVVADLEKELPFADASFDSTTAVFLFNYIKDYQNLLLEIKRVLKDKAKFMMVLYSGNINEWQRQKEVNNFDAQRWIGILENYFSVFFYEKDGLWFFRCASKTKIY